MRRAIHRASREEWKVSKPIQKEQRVIKRHAHTLSALRVTVFIALPPSSTSLWTVVLSRVSARFHRVSSQLSALLAIPNNFSNFRSTNEKRISSARTLNARRILRTVEKESPSLRINLKINFSEIIITHLLLCPLSKLGSLLSFILLFAFTQGAAINDKVYLIHFFL